MPRKRQLVPGIAQSKSFAALPTIARLAYVYALTIADDYGFFRGEPAHLKSALFPYDSKCTPEVLRKISGVLVENGLWRVWRTSDDDVVFEIVQWSHEQQVSHPSKSLLREQLVEQLEHVPLGVSGKAPEDVRKVSGSVPEPRVRERARARIRKWGGEGTESELTTKAVTQEEGIGDPDSRETWLTPFFLAWRLRYGGDPPGGRLAKAMKPLVAEHGEVQVLAHWEHYLDRTDAQYANPQTFASKFGAYAPAPEAMSPLTQEEFFRAQP